MKTNSVQNFKTVKKNSVSNNVAKTGALVGAVASGTYLLRNRADIFTKNINNAKKLGLYNNNVKARLFGIPAGFALGLIGVGALLGKTFGLIAEKMEEIKCLNESKKVIAEKLKEEIKNLEPVSLSELEKIDEMIDYSQEETLKDLESIPHSELEKIGEMIDNLQEETLKDIEKPIDFEYIDKCICPQCQDENWTDNNEDYAD